MDAPLLESLEGSGVFCFNWRARADSYGVIFIREGLERECWNSPPNPTMNIKHNTITAFRPIFFFLFNRQSWWNTHEIGIHNICHWLLFVPGISCLGTFVPVCRATCFPASGVWFERWGPWLCQGALRLGLGPCCQVCEADMHLSTWTRAVHVDSAPRAACCLCPSARDQSDA